MGFLRIQFHRRDESGLELRDEPINALRSICRTLSNEYTVPSLASALYFAAVYHPKTDTEAADFDASIKTWRNPGSNFFAIGIGAPEYPPRSPNEWERHDQMLQELRELSSSHPEIADVRKYLAMTLFVTAIYRGEDAAARFDACVNELETVAESRPDDDAVKAILAMTFANVIRVDPPFALVQQTVSRMTRHSQDSSHAIVWDGNLAGLLRYVVTNAANAGRFDQRDAYLDELRRITHAHPDVPSFRLYLAQALFTVHMQMKEEGKLNRRDDLLLEVRELHLIDPEHAEVRAYFAKTMLHTLNHAKLEGDLERREWLLGELRELAERYAPDEDVLENVAMGVANTVINASTKEELGAVDGLITELQELDKRFRQNASVRDHLSKALRSAHIHACEARRTPAADSHLAALRDLMSTSLVAVAQNFAAALEFRIRHCVDTELRNKRQLRNFWQELYMLASSHELNEPINQSLAFATYNVRGKLFDLSTQKQRRRFLEILRIAAKRHSASAAIVKMLAAGIFDAFNAIPGSRHKQERRELLAELRILHNRNPDNADIAVHTGLVLCNTVGRDVQGEPIDELISEISCLAERFMRHSRMREAFSKALYNGVSNAFKKGHQQLAQQRLDLLRQLYRNHPTDGDIGVEFVGALFMTLFESTKRNAPMDDDLLLELRAVSASFEDDLSLDGGMTMGMMNRLTYGEVPEVSKLRQTKPP